MLLQKGNMHTEVDSKSQNLEMNTLKPWRWNAGLGIRVRHRHASVQDPENRRVAKRYAVTSHCSKYPASISNLLHTFFILTSMDNWSKLSAGLSSLNLGQSAGKLAKGFNSSVQATRERLGQVAPDEITELPQGLFCLTRHQPHKY